MVLRWEVAVHREIPNGGRSVVLRGIAEQVESDDEKLIAL